MQTKYFYVFLFLAGFAFLPFLWTINAVWFFREAFHKPEFDEQPQIKQCITFNVVSPPS